jgi:hypothetical protein
MEATLMEYATMTSAHTLELPAEIAQKLQPSDRFIVWLEGDTLHLKRIAPSPLKQVEEAPEGELLSLDEIDEIVHEVRQKRQTLL